MHERSITYFEKVNKFSPKNSQVKIFRKSVKIKNLVPLIAKKAKWACGGIAPFTRL
jgi:hypothetical protein